MDCARRVKRTILQNRKKKEKRKLIIVATSKVVLYTL
jgi:hypothetical protein